MSPAQPVTCSALLAQVADGDRAAFRQLYALTGPKLFAICLRMMKTRSEAEDVFQDAYVRIWERSWQFDPAKGDGLAWLATIARNSALDRLRQRRQNHVSIDEDVTVEIDKALSVTPTDMGESRDLGRCLSKLREDYRNVVVLAYMRGLTHKEMATSLNKPVGTIKVWTSRGLAQLKECMQS